MVWASRHNNSTRSSRVIRNTGREIIRCTLYLHHKEYIKKDLSSIKEYLHVELLIESQTIRGS